MADKPPLGRLERDSLREYWAREDTEFTPWLARDENISLLNKTLGLALVVESTEKAVGNFRADIVCSNEPTGDVVLIENQLEATDHTHLGQILTYAAGLQALTAIWIAETIREEHRAALDWLNRITGDGFYFFGIEVELWRIGDSPWAPKFNVVARPNDWSNLIAASTRGGTGANAALHQSFFEFWTKAASIMQKRSDLPFAPPGPTARSWITFDFGTPYFMVNASCSASNNSVVGIWAIASGTEEKAARFLHLQDRQALIEERLGQQVEFVPSSKQPGGHIGMNWQGDAAAEDSLEKSMAWMIDALTKLHLLLGDEMAEFEAKRAE